jgi:hypothetical protein
MRKIIDYNIIIITLTIILLTDQITVQLEQEKMVADIATAHGGLPKSFHGNEQVGLFCKIQGDHLMSPIISVRNIKPIISIFTRFQESKWAKTQTSDHTLWSGQ